MRVNFKVEVVQNLDTMKVYWREDQIWKDYVVLKILMKYNNSRIRFL